MADRLAEVVEGVRRDHAPDPRTSIYEVDIVRESGAFVVYGATSVPAAAEALHGRLATVEIGTPIRDELIRLPLDVEGFAAHGVVRTSTAPILAGPMISEPH